MCYIDNFYTLRDETSRQFGLGDIEFLEKKGFDYEKKLLPRIVDKFRHKNVYLNSSYHESLINIYLSLKQRNLFYRRYFQSMDLAALTEKHIKDLKPMKAVIEQLSGEDFDSFMGKIKGQIVDDSLLPEEMHKQMLVESHKGTNEAINDAKKALERLNLYLLEPSREKDYFLTSDNPGFTLLANMVFNTNFGRFDSIGFPINSRQAVFLTGQSNQSTLEIHKRINFISLDPKAVERFNHCTIFNANELVFCESKKFLTEAIGSFLDEHGPYMARV